MGEVLADAADGGRISTCWATTSTRPRTQSLSALGGKAAASPAEVAGCGVIALAVFNTDQVEEVTEKALLPNVKPGTVVLCTSTCDPDRIEALGQRLAGSKHPLSGNAGVRHQRAGARRATASA